MVKTFQSNNKAFKRRLLSWVEKFHSVPILVVGDLMVDRSIRGRVERISPEAPVPVLDITEQTQTPGGAGNVAHNLVALGAKPTLISLRGDDSAGEAISADLLASHINVEGLFVDPDRPTTTKTRVIAGQQQVVRLDQERRAPLSKTMLKLITSQIAKIGPRNRGLILSDYGKGLICPPVIRTAIRIAHRHGVFIAVDPKIEHFFQYRGVDCLTPNTKESIEGMRSLSPKTEEELIALGWRIVKKLNSRSLLLTRGEKGMLIYEKGGRVRSIPTRAREVFDVTGAGDTVISTFSLARAVGAPLYEAAVIANFAASIVVAKLGTAVASYDELVRVIRED